MTESVKIRLQYLVVLLSVTITGLLLHRGHFSEEPSGIHTWTQSDHYALARGFQENGLNFFRPETFFYHENPGKEASTVTAVDFPIHNYIPAVIMKLSGSESPAIYHWYLFLISIIGLFYLYRLAHLFNKSMILSLLIVFFVAASPVFTFYQIRFIPSVPSLSTAFIGFYYYFVYRENQRLRTLVIALGFLTLSALTRMTFLIPLLAVCGQEFFFLVRQNKERWKKLGLIVAAGILFLSYTMYNAWLRKQFGGIFLTNFIPAASINDFFVITREVFRIWKWEYLTWLHCLLLLVCVLKFLYLRFIRKVIHPQTRENSLLILFLLLGSSAFYLVMIGQFIAHDYYFIDAFLIPGIVILSLFSSYLVPETRFALIISWIAIPCVIGALLFLNFKTQDARHEQERFGENARVISNFKDGEKLLNQLGIPQNALIAVLDPSPCNLPFLYLHRKGYINMKNTRSGMQQAMEFPCNYYVFQNTLFVQSVYKFYPEITSKLEVLGTDGKITVCRKKESKTKSLLAFLKLENRNPIYSASAGLRKAPWNWEVSTIYDTVEKCWITSPSSEYGPGLKIKSEAFFRESRTMLITGEISRDESKDLEWVLSYVENGEVKVYQTYSIAYASTGNGKWKAFQFLFTLPAGNGAEGEMATYILNNGLEHRYRNLSCRIY